ncbi:MAG: deoxyribose-phosphate aldolase [Anaerolineaceae bacterium]|jgi:deoxyribose-phosphate aldolase
MDNTNGIFSPQDIARMIDISAVRADSVDKTIEEVVRQASKYGCYLVAILPSQTMRAKKLLEGQEFPKIGGNVGFPSGGHTTRVKVAETRELIEMGVDEIDMVIDIAAHLSGRYKDVFYDMRAVIEAAERKPVKTILECNYLNDNQIRIGCDLAIEAGAAFIKTGTGWTPSGATMANISLIKDHVGNRIQIKASGGIRKIDTLLEMRRRGATRFGISLASASKIIDSAIRLCHPTS